MASSVLLPEPDAPTMAADCRGARVKSMSWRMVSVALSLRLPFCPVPTWLPPGLTVVFWNFSGRLSVLLSWVDDCLSASEVDTLEQGLRSALLEEDLS